MAGHLAIVEVNAEFNKVFKDLIYEFGNTYYNVFDSSDKKIGIILGEKWFLRTNSSTGIAIIIEELSEVTTRIEIVSYAGGEGFLNISWGAHKSYVRDVIYFLKRRGYSVSILKEIDYLDKTRIPKEIINKIASL